MEITLSKLGTYLKPSFKYFRWYSLVIFVHSVLTRVTMFSSYLFTICSFYFYLCRLCLLWASNFVFISICFPSLCFFPCCEPFRRIRSGKQAPVLAGHSTWAKIAKCPPVFIVMGSFVPKPLETINSYANES